jgi:hypothetical protein
MTCIGAGGNGSVVFAQVVDRHFEWKNCQVTLLEPRKIRVQDLATETLQDLFFARDRVVEVGLGVYLCISGWMCVCVCVPGGLLCCWFVITIAYYYILVPIATIYFVIPASFIISILLPIRIVIVIFVIIILCITIIIPVIAVITIFIIIVIPLTPITLIQIHSFKIFSLTRTSQLYV